MPILPQAVTGIMTANLAANAFFGITVPQLAGAFGLGFSSYMVSGPVIQTTDTGTLGAGVGTGPGLILDPLILISSLNATFTAQGIIGAQRTQLINAVALTVSASLPTGIITTASAGVGVGAGIVTSVIPNPALSVPTMIGSFTSFGLLGVLSANLATAIALGIDQALPSSQGAVVIAGPPNIIPGAGVGIGKIL